MTPEAAFLQQAEACDSLGSPFMGRLLRAIAPRVERGGPVYDRLLAWQGDLTPAGASVPLRVASGLHRLVLGGAAPGLAAVYPPNTAGDAALVAAAEAAFAADAAFFDSWLESPPQTNEVRRSAVLIAAAHFVAGHHALPFRLTELGASAGLNLVFDRMALDGGAFRLGPAETPLVLRPEIHGDLPEARGVTVTERAGVDLRPFDLESAEDRLRLLSYLWPDQAHRREATEAAVALARQDKVQVEAGDAAKWLEHRLATPVPGTVHMVYHTVAWQYFPAETAARCQAAIEAAGAGTTEDTPLAWVGMEADGGKGAGLTLRLWPDDRSYTLGRADFHGRWMGWCPRPV